MAVLQKAGMWAPANIASLNDPAITPTTNPFKLATTHPHYRDLILTQAAATTYIGKETDTTACATRLQQIFREVMIRRGYASVNPATKEELVGASLKPLDLSRVKVSGTAQEVGLYKTSPRTHSTRCTLSGSMRGQDSARSGGTRRRCARLSSRPLILTCCGSPTG
jgi:hypothetical protein